MSIKKLLWIIAIPLLLLLSPFILAGLALAGAMYLIGFVTYLDALLRGPTWLKFGNGFFRVDLPDANDPRLN